MARRPPAAGGSVGSVEAGPDSRHDGDGQGAVVRRAPFSDNPTVGARGQRAQQRILDAALQVFGESGYHECGVVRITQAAGCSRAAFYQYFASKEDVFRHLAGQVARQLAASDEALDTITPDAAGLASLRAWAARHLDIYERYEPVFLAYEAAEESDDALASGSARVLERSVARVRAKVEGSVLARRDLDATIVLLLRTLTRTARLAHVIRSVAPLRSTERDVVADAEAAVFHRTLFGRLPGCNDLGTPPRRAEALPGRGELVGRLAEEPLEGDRTPASTRTLEGLLQAGQVVLASRGYHRTRVDDITSAAGTSHGAFYRYFSGKDHIVRVLASRAVMRLSVAFTAIPGLPEYDRGEGTEAVRAWLRRYADAQIEEGAMMRVWVDATARDPDLRQVTSAALDWGRSRLAGVLAPRGFGDTEAEALVLLAVVDTLTLTGDDDRLLLAVAGAFERGFLGR